MPLIGRGGGHAIPLTPLAVLPAAGEKPAMCGIAGYWTKGNVNPELLTRMEQCLAHRGPDDSTQWSDPEAGIGFAHRRLAIVDLSPGGRQPMV